MQSYSLFHSDTFIAISGEQNISFSFEMENLQQRIDRDIQRSSRHDPLLSLHFLTVY